MKFRTVVRMQMILMGLGIALVLASSAYAQQDTNPPIFPDSGNVEPFHQPATVTNNNVITFTIDPANAAAAQQVIASQVTSDEEPAAQETSATQLTTWMHGALPCS